MHTSFNESWALVFSACLQRLQKLPKFRQVMAPLTLSFSRFFWKFKSMRSNDLGLRESKSTAQLVSSCQNNVPSWFSIDLDESLIKKIGWFVKNNNSSQHRNHCWLTILKSMIVDRTWSSDREWAVSDLIACSPECSGHVTGQSKFPLASAHHR